MSTDLGTLKKTGSRNVDINLTRFWGGGDDKGVCVQLTAKMESGGFGYVQLSVQDIITLMPILKKEVIDIEAERREKQADELIENHKELKKSLISDIKEVSNMIRQFESFDLGNMFLFGKQEFEAEQG